MNKQKETVRVKDVIGNIAADDDEKGDKIYSEVKSICINEKLEGCGIDIDFSGLEIINTAFLNNAIGKLFRKGNGISLDNIRIVNYPSELKELLVDVIEMAILKDGEIENE